MKKTAFDIISDLYLTTNSKVSWTNKTTSLYCIVAGNISEDRNVLIEFLTLLSAHYKAVFYIDGDLDHSCYEGNIKASYRNLHEQIDSIENVVFLHDSIIILDNVTLMGVNGWSTLSPNAIRYLDESQIMSKYYANNMCNMAVSDQNYLYNSVEKCQELNECVNVIIVTNTVPIYDFISHNDKYLGSIDGELMSNNGLISCLSLDKYEKLHTWVFGKFEDPVNYTINNLNYVSNPGKEVGWETYFPKRIEI